MQVVEKIILSDEERKAFDVVSQTLADIQRETMDKSLANEIDDVLDFMHGFCNHIIEE